MKKLFIILISMAMFVFFSPFANAQSSTCAANATVVPTMTISKLADVNFGQILSTTSGAVDLKPTGTGSTNVGTSAAAGEFQITGGLGASVSVTYDASVTLNGPSSNTMTLNTELAGLSTSTQGSATAFTGSPETITLDGTSGDYYIWVGGSLGSLSSQATGTYTGTFNISVAYN
ncbi:MAG: DUF4402 domain-containing protein [Ignavibacteriaceae bacterium]